MERVIVDTYQAVSGSGNKAVMELEDQVRAHVAGEPLQASVYPYPIAFNVLPHIDVFMDSGYTKEEWKVIVETEEDPASARSAGLLHGRARPGGDLALRGRPRRAHAADEPGPGP